MFYRIAPTLFATFALFSSTVIADSLSQEAIQGKWRFTHIVMDGDREVKVNQTVDFRTDGSAVYYGAGGNESARGSYVVESDAIRYTDNKGEQVWKLLSFEDGRLHVDHRGAHMFFEKE